MPPDPIKLVCLNIETSRHLDRAIPFLVAQQPDIICLQEVMAADLPRILAETGMRGRFASMRYITGKDSAETPQLGVAILSKYPADSWQQAYYGNFHDIGFYAAQPEKRHTHTVFLQATFGQYVIATTHFTWTPDGKPSKEQRMNLERLLCTAKAYPELILCGDFNAPRGEEIFDTLAANFMDTVPASVTTSIDGTLHKAGPLELMVDGLFVTPGYAATAVQVLDGVSDHCALVAQVSLTRP